MYMTPQTHEVTWNWKSGERGEKESFTPHHSRVGKQTANGFAPCTYNRDSEKPIVRSWTSKERYVLRWMWERNRESVCIGDIEELWSSTRKGRQRSEGGNAELQSVVCIKIYLYTFYIHLCIYICMCVYILYILEQDTQVNSSFTVS